MSVHLDRCNGIAASSRSDAAEPSQAWSKLLSASVNGPRAASSRSAKDRPGWVSFLDRPAHAGQLTKTRRAGTGPLHLQSSLTRPRSCPSAHISIERQGSLPRCYRLVRSPPPEGKSGTRTETHSPSTPTEVQPPDDGPAVLPDERSQDRRLPTATPAIRHDLELECRPRRESPGAQDGETDAAGAEQVGEGSGQGAREGGDWRATRGAHRSPLSCRQVAPSRTDPPCLRTVTGQIRRAVPRAYCAGPRICDGSKAETARAGGRGSFGGDRFCACGARRA